MNTQTAPDTITWAAMTAAGIDTNRVERIENGADSGVPTWKATSADSTKAIVFGVCLDEIGRAHV